MGNFKNIITRVNRVSLKLKCYYLTVAVKYVLSYCISRLFLKKLFEEDIWIISERGDEARDNAYHLFRYIRLNHPEVPIYYLIKRNAPDREKIENFGNIIDFGSFKHYLYYMCSKVCISTHIYNYVPDKKVFKHLDYIFKNIKYRAFIQHGITMNFHPSDMYEDNCIDLFICGAKAEHNYIVTNFGYPTTVAKCTGLSRYDALTNFQTKKQILIMPTWRGYLSTLTEDDFQESIYFKTYNSLINDTKLINFAKDNGYKIIFYPHYEMQKFIHLFPITNDLIILAKHGDYDVQTLLKESELLITDYSSIHFDFAYMKKPVFYFQFDSVEFYSSHYQKGYFCFNEHGFGEVITDLSILVEKVINKVENNNKIDKVYKSRIVDFFTYCDNNNCKRNYEAILKGVSKNQRIRGTKF